MSCSWSNSFENCIQNAFGREKTWLRSKGTILNDTFQVTYVLRMIYLVGKKQNSGQKRNDINLLESDLIVLPPSPLEFPGPLTPLPLEFPRGGGVWIFSGPTQLVTKLVDS